MYLGTPLAHLDIRASANDIVLRQRTPNSLVSFDSVSRNLTVEGTLDADVQPTVSLDITCKILSTNQEVRLFDLVRNIVSYM